KAATELEATGLPGNEILKLAASSWASKSDEGIDLGLMPGDVIFEIDGDQVRSREEAIRFLMNPVDLADVPGAPLRVTVRRGLEHPFSTHPRLDLFLSSTSPHPIATFGCSTCHEG